jgi:hypothetical protein
VSLRFSVKIRFSITSARRTNYHFSKKQKVRERREAMKRFVAFALSVILLFLILLPTVSAADTDAGEAQRLKNAAVFSCVYSEDKQIVIEGTVNHDVMLNHRDYTI